MNLLIVEKEPLELENLARTFIADGYQVVVIGHPRQALEAASFRQFHAAIINYDLPDMDGIELTRRLRATQRSLQVILLADKPLPANMAFACLVKPYGLLSLAMMVRDACEEAAEVAFEIASCRKKNCVLQ